MKIKRIGIFTSILLVMMLASWFCLKHMVTTEQISAFIQRELKVPIQLDGHAIKWLGAYPTIRLQSLDINLEHVSGSPQLRIKRLDIQIDWLESLMRWQWTIKRVLVKEPQLVLSPRVSGEPSEFDDKHMQTILGQMSSWLSHGIVIKRASILQRDQQSQIPILTDATILMSTSKEHPNELLIKLKGRWRSLPMSLLLSDLNANADIEADMQLSFGAPSIKVNGQMTMSDLKHNAWLHSLGVHQVKLHFVSERQDVSWKGRAKLSLISDHPLPAQMELELGWDTQKKAIFLQSKQLVFDKVNLAQVHPDLSDVKLKLKLLKPHMKLYWENGLKYQIETAIEQGHLDYKGYTLAGLSGQFNMTEIAGLAQLHMQSIQVPACSTTKQNGFDNVLTFKWHKDKVLHLNIAKSQLQMCGMTLKTSGNATFNKDQLSVDLKGDFSHISLKSFSRIWLDQMPKDTFHTWLSRNVSIEKPFKGTFEYRTEQANTEPLLKGLELNAEIKDFDFIFDKDWLPLKNTDADIALKNGLLNMRLTGGTTHQMPVKEVKASMDISDVSPTSVHVELLSKTDFAVFLDLLAHSPIKEDMPDFKPFRFSGDSHIKLLLDIPLPKPDRVAIDASIKLDHANMHMIGKREPLIRHFDGTLSIRQPLGASKLSQSLNLKLKGFHQLSFQNVPHHLSYQGKLDVNYQRDPKSWHAHYHAKLSKHSQHLPFSTKSIDRDLEAFDVKGYVSKSHTTVNWHTPFKARGSLDFYPLKNRQVDIQGELHHIPFSDLKPLVDFIDQSIETKQIGFLQHTWGDWDITIEKSNLFDQMIDKLTIKRKKEDKDWHHYSLIGKDISGHIWHHHLHQNMLVMLDHLKYRPTKQKGDFRIDVNEVPNMLVWIKDLTYQQRPAGEVHFRLIPHTESFSKSVDSPKWRKRIEAQGISSFTLNKPSLHFSFKAYKLHDLLKTFKGFDKVTANSGWIELDSSWDKSLKIVRFENLVGHGQLQLRSGQVAVDKQMGGNFQLGKLLSILNVNSLPKRFLLDFRDVTENKYFFNDMWADFKLDRGRMEAKHLSFQGSSADIEMKGTIDLPRQQLNMSATIIPKYTSGLPIIATVAGGPIAGVTTWIANGIIGDNLNQLKVYQYHLHGPLSSFKITQVNNTERS